jgi:hypothetical protein
MAEVAVGTNVAAAAEDGSKAFHVGICPSTMGTARSANLTNRKKGDLNA